MSAADVADLYQVILWGFISVGGFVCYVLYRLFFK